MPTILAIALSAASGIASVNEARAARQQQARVNRKQLRTARNTAALDLTRKNTGAKIKLGSVDTGLLRGTGAQKARKVRSALQAPSASSVGGL